MTFTAHGQKHPLAGKTVGLKLAPPATPVDESDLTGQEFVVEDWWDHLTGKSWMFTFGNPAVNQYARRSGLAELPTDDDVIYGKIGHLGYLVHASEIGEVIA